MNFLAYVRIRRSRAGIGARHLPIADRREQHRHHGDQDGGHHVAASLITDYAVNAHRGDGLNDHDTDDDQVPEPQGSSQARCSGSTSSGVLVVAMFLGLRG